ncbi:MAG TPA: phospho-sugar mutase [Cyclobacteriaceae bacterium]|nr:phospho-sugar mutase [Cyclobacteriaceae bacterium]HMV08946.1 phospho-sugar mutase [Cyclobacteriaceae bacterium]HMV90141.1 phospho-sugar mutase [Cyclobacteriaceae bacterium]HMX00299.1 phospho-sugar mutase [Cyclobacteriaceae bacterium]HMX49702.1 phospho-sugar mutase [Cyclobacteriaceae bacterium]
MSDLLQNVKVKAQQWLDSPVIDSETKQKVQALLNNSDTKELVDNFYKDLEFGTGGLRGIMGVGSNTMNKYTVGVATQGLANYLLKTYPGKTIKVALAHDSRNNSPYFTQIVADVFSANGIEVYKFAELRPTPLLSFAIRYLKCDSGVVITASHNPKEYNGYKAYWNDGAQVVPPHDKNIIREVNAITSFEQVKFNADKSKIHTIGPEVEQAYYAEVKKIIPNQDKIKRQHNIPLVYTSIHGAGITMVPECLKQIGFTNIQVVDEQKTPDGNFPTVASPNPEERSAMEMVIAKGKAVGATMVMATDPDTDRVGIGVRNAQNEFILLNGNQAFSLMMWFIMKSLKDRSNAYIAKTIVTSELVDLMAKNYNIECYNTLTGFKYIAELMRNLEGKKKFIAAGEESYGYMAGDFVRDKDAVSACAFFAAMAASAADEGKSLYDWLIEMYAEHAYYKEALINVTKKGQQGEQEIKAMMEKFRNNPPATINNSAVTRLLDYQTLTEKDLKSGNVTKLDFPKSDVIQFYLEDGTKVSVRPSGTEPKIKFYISVNTKLASKNDFDAATKKLDEKIKGVEQYLQSV